MKNTLWSILAFITYAVICLFILHYSHGRLGLLTGSSINKDLDTIAIQQQKLRLTDSLNRIEELKIAKENLINNDSLNAETDSLLLDNIDLSDRIYTPAVFTIKNQFDRTIIACDQYLRILQGSEKVRIPDGCKNYGLQLKKFAVLQPNSQIVITGSSSPVESSAFGRRRAEYVKNLLLSIGINNKQIITKSNIQNILYNNGVANGGVEIMVVENTENTANGTTTNQNSDKTIVEPVNGMTYNRITSGFKENVYLGDQKTTLYISKLRAFLNANPSKKITIYSHTQPLNNPKENLNVSNKNAETLKKIMVEAGIASTKIKLIPKGDASSNGTGINNRALIVTVN